MLKIRGLSTVIKYILSAALSLALFGAVSATAASPTSLPTMTQVEFLQWLVQLSGDTGTLPAHASAADYVQWAQNQGITPPGGWQPNAVLTRDVLAQTLVQFFNINVKAGSDAIRALQREGIDVPGVTDGSEIKRKDFTTMLDVNGFSTRSSVLHGKKHTKIKTPTKDKTPTKKKTPPKQKTVKPPKVPTPGKH